jgi:hypothetical protein
VNVSNAIRVTVLVLSLVALSALPVSADPVTLMTLNYTGFLNYHDLGDRSPEQIAIETGFFDYGVVSGGLTVVGQHDQGSPVAFSMTINTSAPATVITNPLGYSFTQYSQGLLAATFSVGPLTYSLGPTNLHSDWLFSITPVAGPSLVGSNGLTMVPDHLSLYDSGSSGFITINNAAVWLDPIVMFSFAPAWCQSSCGTHYVYSHLQLTSVSVPEPSTLCFMGIGLLAVHWRLRVRRSRRIPARI